MRWGSKRGADAASQRFDNEVALLRLRLFAAARAYRAISVLGQSRGVGATSLSVALARSLARQARRTVLVDGNFGNPALADLFQIPTEPGAGNALDRGLSLPQIARATSDPHLTVVPCGDSETSKLTPSVEQWRRLWRTLEADQVAVIDAGSADSPAALTMADSSDGVILVVEYGQSRREQVQAVKDRLALSGTPLLGAILNQRRYVVPPAIYRRL
jgi:Mrp family chromosome partitioning ATPase